MSELEDGRTRHPAWLARSRGVPVGRRRALSDEGSQRAANLPDADRADDWADLRALVIRERAQTLRLGLCVLAAVGMIACLIPIANARPRWRPLREAARSTLRES
jgi:hypothetical protein